MQHFPRLFIAVSCTANAYFFLSRLLRAAVTSSANYLPIKSCLLGFRSGSFQPADVAPVCTELLSFGSLARQRKNRGDKRRYFNGSRENEPRGESRRPRVPFKPSSLCVPVEKQTS